MCGLFIRPMDPCQIRLCLKKIEGAIASMDETYDANFGDWIRNEDNCKLVGTHLRRYIESYRESDFITVIKWIIKDWTLKSIILFAKKIIIDDITNNELEQYIRRVNIITGFIYTWNPIFISEFLLASTAEQQETDRVDFFASVLPAFEARKLAQILMQIEGNLHETTKNLLALRCQDAIYKKSKEGSKRTESLVDAYNLM